MNAKEIIEQSTADGLTLSFSHDGNIKVVGDQNIIDEWLPLIREHKSHIVVLLKKELKQQQVLEMLESDPDKKYVLVVEDVTSDPVLVIVGIRGIAVFELQIPQAHYDGIALLEVIEQYSTDLKHQAETNPLPVTIESGPAHPGEFKRKAA